MWPPILPERGKRRKLNCGIGNYGNSNTNMRVAI